uniref:ERAD-associated E3 ubiquitin-protein ligase component HRD3A n=1 Tax=Kalanchoe fedtschenkoi TaxID=63787 RepID=A0A7N0V977_KALFE
MCNGCVICLLQMYEKAVALYAELAELAVNSFMISKDSSLMEPVRIHSGTEETKLAKGEEDEEFQIMEYEADRGNAEAMYHVGLFHFYGLRGLRRDHKKAFSWFLKAVEKGEPKSMEILAEIYARGIGVDRNYTKALEWLQRATKLNYFSAYNGMGYLYVKGYGVEKNLTKAKEYFKLASEKKDAGGLYNLGIMYLKGIGVKKDAETASQYFVLSANKGLPKAFYQLAKIFHKGIGMKPNLAKAITLYKLVAERGPWSSMSRWALESYAKGDLGKALLLYLRMAELGFEVAQSNAAWILDKYGDRSMCMGEAGFCTDTERYQRAHVLWWQASEQGNEHAALLIGDAYYYGRGTERDYIRAAEAYMQAKSQANAQAMFNLGYMYEHGEGLPLDLHLAKRNYDEALEIDPSAKFPVTLALASLWLRMNFANSFMVDLIDSLPYAYPKVEAWVETVLLEEGNVTILTLCACLVAVLFLRERQRRHAGNRVGAQNPMGQVEPAMF